MAKKMSVQEEEVQKPRPRSKQKQIKKEEPDEKSKKVTSTRIQTVGGITPGRITKRDWESDAPWNRKDQKPQPSRFEKRGRTADD